MANTKHSLYKQIDIQSQVASATPHQLIAMLFDAAVKQMHLALHACSFSDTEALNNALTQATDLVSGLRESLIFEEESELPFNLDSIYDYIQRRLVSARLSDPVDKVTQALDLLQMIG